MRVALVTPYSWSVPGGVNTHVADLAVELRHRGHEVRILGVSEGEAPAGVIRVGRTTPIPINQGIARVAISPLLAGRVRVALRRARPEVIHIHEPFVSTVTLATIFGAPAPIVATFHSGARTLAYRRLRPFLRPLWDRITVRIAVSNAARGLVEDAFGPGARIIPNGVDVETFERIAAPPESPRVLFFGRLEPRKGPQVLARAWKAVEAAVPRAELVIAGDGGLRASLATELSGARVRFAGAFGRPKLLELLTHAQVACLPAVGGESFGITLIEAMAAGRALVATAVPGYTSVVRNPSEGILVLPEDPDHLAAELIRVLTDAPLRHALEAGGKARARRFAWPRVTDEILEAYRDARGGGHRID